MSRLKQKKKRSYSPPGPRRSSKGSSGSTDWCVVRRGAERPFDLACTHHIEITRGLQSLQFSDKPMNIMKPFCTVYKGTVLNTMRNEAESRTGPSVGSQTLVKTI